MNSGIILQAEWLNYDDPNPTWRSVNEFIKQNPQLVALRYGTDTKAFGMAFFWIIVAICSAVILSVFFSVR